MNLILFIACILLAIIYIHHHMHTTEIYVTHTLQQFYMSP